MYFYVGRISFRSIKKNRDYMQHRTHCSWHYLAHLAAVREFAYLKALHSHGFPVPGPVDMNRHAVLMEYIDAIPLTQVRPMSAFFQFYWTLAAIAFWFPDKGTG